MPDEPLLTRYRMLKSIDDGKTWTKDGDQDAHNAESALKKFYGIPEEGVQIVAVTERSWRPVVRAVKIVETEVLEAVELPVAQPVSIDDQFPERLRGQTAITPEGDVEVPPASESLGVDGTII